MGIETRRLTDCLREPSLARLDIDGQERFALHGEILARKPMLQKVFQEFHHTFRRLEERFLTGKGIRIELGAGIAPMRDSDTGVLATDVIDAPHLDRRLDAEAMDLDEGSVRVFFGQNCFHHFPHPDRFFAELERVLADGGGAILLEPYYGPVATLLYKRLFSSEGYDKSQHAWETPATGPMHGANQALSYIVFVRDRLAFERQYPRLKVVHQERCGNYLEYLLSGGLNFRQICPDGLTPLVRLAQWLLSPFNRWLALHHIVVIRKGAE